MSVIRLILSRHEDNEMHAKHATILNEKKMFISVG